MKKMQRLWSILLALALLLGLKSPAQAAQGDGVKLSMTVSQSSIRVGETVSLTIRADKDVTTRGSGMTIYYDDTVLELDAAGSVTAAPLTISGPLTVNGKSAFRISFLPGLDAATFSADQPLAEIRFKARAVSGQTGISMGAAYLYDASLMEIPVTMPDSVNVMIEPAAVYIPVTGIGLDMTELTIREGEMAALKATIEPHGASDPTIIWTSSNERTAIVSDGVVKALTEGTATITATTQDGGFSASCIVTVKAPDAGYTVRMPADTTAAIGSTVQIPVSISNEDGRTGYNAFDISFVYDPAVLELMSTTLPGATVTATPGRIHVLGYGEDRGAGSVPFTLEFRALKMETTAVQITTARVDHSGNAVVRNASAAVLRDDRTVITVTGYPVTLPEGFVGAETAAPNADYTFTEPADHFDYSVQATVGGTAVAVTDHGDGTYTIPAELVTGEIVVTAAKTGKIFKVTLGTDMTGKDTAQYGTDYVAMIERDDSYRYTVTVTIGGREYTGYTASGKTYTIPGTDITGNIVFQVTKTEIPKPSEPVTMHSVTFTGSGAGAAQGNATSVAHGSSYTFTLKKQTGYSYQVSYKMGGKPAGTVSPNANGTYTIANVTAPLEIRIEKTLNMEISVHGYLTLDETSVFLILADAALDTGYVFTYDGNGMYYSEAYGAWAYLVITDQDMDVNQVRSQVQISTQANRVIPASGGDVDENGQVDWNDAQLIRDLYNATYDTFDSVNMMRFLRADVNGDRKLDVRDVAAVIYRITSSKEG